MISKQEADMMCRELKTEMDEVTLPLFAEAEKYGRSIRDSLRVINKAMRENGIEPEGAITEMEEL